MNLLAMDIGTEVKSAAPALADQNRHAAAANVGNVFIADTGNNRLQTFEPGTTAGWAYNQIGNMTLNDGKGYTYGSKPHAVTSVATASGTTNYTYDGNGSMTGRGASQTLTWDVENRLTGVTGGVSYAYDGDGFRVTKTENSETILYVNKYYEKNLSTGLVTLYYYLGDKLVAYKEMDLLRYIHQDHLTGTSLTTSSENGSVVGSIRYKPFGETRSFTGSAPAHKFTGQRLDEVGLYYYGARYYDPGLGRFVSADTITQTAPLPIGQVIEDLTVSYLANNGIEKQTYKDEKKSNALVLSNQELGYWIVEPQEHNRYTYALNNPLAYTDPEGNQVRQVAIVVMGGLALIPGAGQIVMVVVAATAGGIILGTMISNAINNNLAAKTNSDTQSKDKDGKESKIVRGIGQAPKTAAPNSTYEQVDRTGKVISRTKYGPDGKPLTRADDGHTHYDKKTGTRLGKHEHQFEYNEEGQPIGETVVPRD